MKKLLSILLCAALLATLTPSVFAADKCYQTLSGKTWGFHESDDVKDYGYVGNAANGSTAELVAYSDANGQDDTALKIYRSAATSGNNVFVNFVHNTKTDPVTVSEFKVAFDFKVDNTKATFKFVMRNADDLNAAYWKDGNVYFLEQNVTTYIADKWYHVEILFDIPHGYGQLKIKDCDTGAWTTYNKLAGTDKLKDWVTTCRLGIGMQGAEGTALVDNYYQNYADVPAAFLGSDDFSNDIAGWTGGNLVSGQISLQHADVDGNKMLEIKAENANKKNSSAYKNIPATTTANYPEDTNYYFSFKFGGNAAKGTVGASLETINGTTKTDYFIARAIDNDLKLFGDIFNLDSCEDVPSSFGVPTETNLYKVEAVYNPSKSTLTAAVTNENGEQYIASSGQWSYTPNKFAFRHHVPEIKDENGTVISGAYTAVAHFDDFATDILDDNGPAIVSSDVLSGDTACASIDETAVFTYDRTINQAALAEATVTLGGNTLEEGKDYTITSKGAQVLVSVKGLEKDTPYTVGLSGVKDILGTLSKDAADAAQVAFKTSSVDFTVSQPQLNGTKFSTEVVSYYSQSRTIKLIVAVYDQAETMVKAVEVIELPSPVRASAPLEHDFNKVLTEEANGCKVKCFVWSDFSSMKPYTKPYNSSYSAN